MTTCAKALVFMSILCLAGCVHVSDRDAPGVVDLDAPPRDIEDMRTEVPEDPGQHVTRLTFGYTMMLGALMAQPDRSAVDFVFQPTLEASLAFYDVERSYSGDGIRSLTFPEQEHPQINLGWAPVEIQSGDPNATGAAYLEWQHNAYWSAEDGRPSVSVAGGWAVNPFTLAHGPQVTLSAFYGIASLRAAYLFGGGLYAGVMFTAKYPMFAWAWSR